MKRSKNKGFMMIESVIVTSIVAVAILIVMSVAQKSINVSSQTLHTSQAAFLLEEGAEAIRIMRDDAWSNISNLSISTNYYPVFSGGTWSMSPTASSVGNFTRTVVVSNVNRNATSGDISATGTDDPDAKLITINVSWYENGTVVSKTLSFYIFDIFSS